MSRHHPTIEEKAERRDKVFKLLDQGVSSVAICERLGISKNTLAIIIKGTQYSGKKGKFYGAFGLP